MRHRALIVLVTFASFVALTPRAPAPPAAPTKDPWTPVGDWKAVSDEKHEKKITELVRARVKMMIEPDGAGVKFKYEKAGDQLEFGALRSLALMAALPRLAKQDNNDTGADKNLYDAALKAIDSDLTPVLEVAFPELLSNNTTAPLSLHDMVKRKGKRGKDEISLHLGHRAYGCSVVLMALEFYFAGARDYDYDPAQRKADRGVRRAVPLNLAAQIGVARLTALLLLRHASGKDKFQPEFEAELKPGSAYTYDALGTGPNETCYSKTSTALMGLRAALAMGVADFPAAAFEFELDTGGGKLTKEKFLARLSDVFVHCVLTTTNITEDPAVGAGVIGRTNYANADKKRNEIVPAEEVNVLYYQTRTTRSALDGRPLFRVYHCDTSANPDADLLKNNKPWECAYRYLPGDWRHGAYHTAGGGYTLATSLSALPVVWGDRAAVGKQYKVERVGMEEKWCVHESATTTHDVTLDPKLTLTPVRFGNLPVRERLAQALNFVVRQLSTGGPNQLRTLNKNPTKVKGVDGKELINADAVLTLEPASYHYCCRGIDLYGVFKFFLSTGTPDAVGNWPAFHDIVDLLSDPNYSGLNADKSYHWAHNEFLLLTVQRAYRPIFGRDTPKKN